jgi:phosphoglycerate kinase
MKNIDYSNKRVVIRVDFNVPLDAQFQVTDDTRIRAAIPTLRAVLDQGGSIVLLSHFGRPLKKLKSDGSVDRDKFSLRNIVPKLSEILSMPVKFCAETVGPEAEAACKALNPGEVLLMENTRFHAGEEKGDENLAKQMATLGDIYINDAFGTAHRAHASTAVIANFFPAEAKSFGYLMEAELEGARKVTEQPQRPFVAILGGAKVSDKILLIEKLATIADTIIIGGGMAYTFMRAMGGETGNSLVEEDRIELAADLLSRYKNLLLPLDSVAATAFNNDAQREIMSSQQIKTGWMGLDIGPDAIGQFSTVITQAKTILWNGPMGVFEMENFANGTKAIAEAVAAATKGGAFSLIGGGDSVAAINQLNLQDQVSYVSTGGGAMLELLEGKVLPGVAAINDTGH